MERGKVGGRHRRGVESPSKKGRRNEIPNGTSDSKVAVECVERRPQHFATYHNEISSKWARRGHGQREDARGFTSHLIRDALKTSRPRAHSVSRRPAVYKTGCRQETASKSPFCCSL
ncbi:hypothetical protein J6590_074613 [Homalodisca vitripennis]|nr:hypothetical protein J6590_074613 [Homalodisca vitripennis]